MKNKCSLSETYMCIAVVAWGVSAWISGDMEYRGIGVPLWVSFLFIGFGLIYPLLKSRKD